MGSGYNGILRPEEVVANFGSIEVKPLTGVIADHNLLSGRDAADQHPMASITGLEKALKGKQPAGEYIPKSGLQAAVDSALAQAKSSGEFKGDQGLSPGVEVAAVEGGHRIAITDEQGEKSFVLKDGMVMISDAQGNPAVIRDSAEEEPLCGLTLYGKTTQSAEPSPEAPCEPVGIGEDRPVSVAVCGAVLMDIPDFDLVNPTARTRRILADATLPAGEYCLRLSFSATATRTEAHCQRFESGALKDENCGQLALTDGVVSFVATKPWNALYIYIPASQEEGAAASIRNAALTLCPETEEDYKGAQTIEISVPGGLQGVPVVSGGNHIDRNGQHWVCDEIDLGRGVYVKNVFTYRFTGEETWTLHEDGYLTFGLNEFYAGGAVTYSRGFCGVLPWVNSSNGSGIVVNGKQLRIGKAAVNAYGLTVGTVGSLLAGHTIMWAMLNPVETALPEETVAAYREMRSRKPVSTVFNDGGADMDTRYVADPKNYIDNRFAALEAAILSLGGNV